MATAYKSYWTPSQTGSNGGTGSGAKSSGTGGGVGSDAKGVVGEVVSAEVAAALVGQSVKLSEAESRHLVKVFRARQGDAVTLFDAGGNVWHGTLADTTGRAALVRIERHEPIVAPRPRITLGQALPKGKTMDSVIAAMVELGVAQIAPLASDHSEVRIEKDAARAESKREHWQQTAIEAAKQSSNFYGTHIAPITSLKAFLATLPPLATAAASTVQAVAVPLPSATPATAEPLASPSPTVGPVAQLRIIGSLEEGSVPLASLAPCIAAATEVVCLIGPEGDFSPAEYALARAHGFLPVRLGSHVLRVKTAATYIVSTIDALARAAAVGDQSMKP